MRRSAALTVLLGLTIGLVFGQTNTADAAFRQYYSAWTWYSTYGYHYRSYFYKPTANYDGYKYHYCIYYPDKPRYVYFYNPHDKVYWGRFDTEGQQGEQYSVLAESDRKSKLADIPESAFPSPGRMPAVPESRDGVEIQPPTGLPRERTASKQ